MLDELMSMVYYCNIQTNRCTIHSYGINKCMNRVKTATLTAYPFFPRCVDREREGRDLGEKVQSTKFGHRGNPFSNFQYSRKFDVFMRFEEGQP